MFFSHPYMYVTKVQTIFFSTANFQECYILLTWIVKCVIPICDAISQPRCVREFKKPEVKLLFVLPYAVKYRSLKMMISLRQANAQATFLHNRFRGSQFLQIMRHKIKIFSNHSLIALLFILYHFFRINYRQNHIRTRIF